MLGFFAVEHTSVDLQGLGLTVCRRWQGDEVTGLRHGCLQVGHGLFLRWCARQVLKAQQAFHGYFKTGFDTLALHHQLQVAHAMGMGCVLVTGQRISALE